LAYRPEAVNFTGDHPDPRFRKVSETYYPGDIRTPPDKKDIDGQKLALLISEIREYTLKKEEQAKILRGFGFPPPSI
jgi:hypothetical protein